MEKETVWIPMTPEKPVLTFAEGTGKETINEKLPCTDYFEMMRYMEKSGINKTYELAASILGEHETVLGEARKDPKSTATIQYDTCSIEDETVNVPLLEREDPRLGFNFEESDFIGKIVTSKRNTPRRNKYQTKSFNACNDLLGNDYNQQHGQDLSEIRNQENGRDYVYFYQRRKKISSATTSHIPTLQVYHRSYRENQVNGWYCNPVKVGKIAVRRSHNPKSTATVPYDTRSVENEAVKVPPLDCEDPRLGFNFEESDFIGKIVTSKRNTPRRNKYQTKSLEASNNLLGNNYNQQHGQDISVIRNQEQVDKNGRKYVYFYQRRKKISSATTTASISEVVSRKPVDKIHVRKSHKNLEQSTREKVQNKVNKSKDRKRVVKSDFYTKEWDFHVFFSPPRRQRSRMPTRPNFRRILNTTEKYRLCQEKNFLQIKECLPPQEVLVDKIGTFTSEHGDFQLFSNSDGNVNSQQLHEVPVDAIKSLVPTQEENPLTKKDINNLYVREYMKYLILKFENLDINSEFKQVVARDKNNSGPLVKINPKKRRVPPKVDLDQELLRVWKLLMENDGREPCKETDKDKEEWWGKQRDIFRGRVDSFIAKMHLMQGDRRFSPWESTVSDLVAGAYLTQNMSDHLSRWLLVIPSYYQLKLLPLSNLEGLRDVPPDKAKFLRSIEGIGLKSVECVDTNVGRAATRLGWVPLQTLPDAVQIHLFNPYELHYHLIIFGKVFCTMVRPNCNACPTRGECGHYASVFASNRLALLGSKESSNVTSIVPAANEQNHSISDAQASSVDLEVNHSGSSYHGQTCEPIIEVPPSPEPEVEEKLPTIGDIEDLFCESDDDIATSTANSMDQDQESPTRHLHAVIDKLESAISMAQKEIQHCRELLRQRSLVERRVKRKTEDSCDSTQKKGKSRIMPNMLGTALNFVSKEK